MNLNRTVKDDINLVSKHKLWNNQHADEKTLGLLEKDTRYFIPQSLSTQCLDVLRRAEGASLESVSGKRYIDFHGNYVHQVGYAHPRIIENVVKQLQKLPFSPEQYTNKPAIKFAKKLASLAPSNLNRILFTTTGSSAIAMALKLARAVTGKHKVMSFWDYSHVTSLDTMSVGGESFWRENKGGIVPTETINIPPPITYRGIFEDNESKCLEYIEYTLSKEANIGAFLAETVRNIDVQIPSKNFWKEVRALCNKYGVLLILDEISIALGRTGYMFAFEHYDIEPDILCLGKGLGGGIYPQAAMITRDDYNHLTELSLGNCTFEKSPVGAVAGLTTIEIIEDQNLLKRAKKYEAFIKSSLETMKLNHTIIGDVRGIGMLWGIELVKDRITKEKASNEAEKILYYCLEKGLNFKVFYGNVLQLSPALTISRDELNIALNILNEALMKIQ